MNLTAQQLNNAIGRDISHIVCNCSHIGHVCGFEVKFRRGAVYLDENPGKYEKTQMNIATVLYVASSGVLSSLNGLQER